jgi:hypothetical protein
MSGLISLSGAPFLFVIPAQAGIQLVLDARLRGHDKKGIY